MEGLKHPNVEKIVLDVTKEDNIHDVVNTIISREGRIDVLVNNAGVLCIGTPRPTVILQCRASFSIHHGSIGPVIDVPMDVVQKAYDANVFSVIRMCKAVIPHMAKRKSGTIVQISSVGAHMYVKSIFTRVYNPDGTQTHSLGRHLRVDEGGAALALGRALHGVHAAEYLHSHRHHGRDTLEHLCKSIRIIPGSA